MPSGPLDDGLVVPAHEVESFLHCGWRLADEPGCGGVKLLPPVAFVPVDLQLVEEVATDG